MNTYTGIRERIPAEIEENASLDLGRRFFWPCSCSTTISKKITDTNNGTHYNIAQIVRNLNTHIYKIIKVIALKKLRLQWDSNPRSPAY